MTTISDEADVVVPEFDARATRRAVRRGVVRTATLALLALALIASLHQGAVRIWQTRDGNRFEEVLGTALQVANPAHRLWFQQRSGSVTFGTSLRYAARSRGPVEPLQHPDVHLRQDFRGRISPRTPRELLPETPLSRVLEDIDLPTKDDVRARLDRLPAAIVVSGRVELARPMAPEELIPLRRRLSLCGLGPDVLENQERTGSFVTGNTPRADMCDRTWVKTGPVLLEPLPSSGPTRRVSWPDSSLRGLEAWADRLRPMDDLNLARLELPASSRIKTVAAEGRIYAFVVERATPANVRALLDDPDIRGMELAQVELDSGSSSAYPIL